MSETSCKAPEAPKEVQVKNVSSQQAEEVSDVELDVGILPGTEALS